MIKITPDFPCIHCGLCAKACSHGVIKMVPNEEGKPVPKVAFASCRYCRACRWACPVIPKEEVSPTYIMPPKRLASGPFYSSDLPGAGLIPPPDGKNRGSR